MNQHEFDNDVAFTCNVRKVEWLEYFDGVPCYTEDDILPKNLQLKLCFYSAEGGIARTKIVVATYPQENESVHIVLNSFVPDCVVHEEKKVVTIAKLANTDDFDNTMRGGKMVVKKKIYRFLFDSQRVASIFVEALEVAKGNNIAMLDASETLEKLVADANIKAVQNFNLLAAMSSWVEGGLKGENAETAKSIYDHTLDLSDPELEADESRNGDNGIGDDDNDGGKDSDGKDHDDGSNEDGHDGNEDDENHDDADDGDDDGEWDDDYIVESQGFFSTSLHI
mmetsp:Transcript_23726/g.67013  ORF Transcript_23726/g.67013 Transcript_23726/m.67013 type:complete len:281 (-) Transcript_23726:35-877(-)